MCLTGGRPHSEDHHKYSFDDLTLSHLLTDAGVPIILLCGAAKNHCVNVRQYVGIVSGEIKVLDPRCLYSDDLAPEKQQQ